MKTVRIAAGAGFGGDRIEPALDIIKRGNVDYIMFECLAERTIALAQKDKLDDPARGYNPLLEYRFEKILPLLKEHPVKIITNMGAANPRAAADKIASMAEKCGLGGLKIAAVLGDDLLERIALYGDCPLIETGGSLGGLDGIVSANAYIGAEAIAEALTQGADIVVTGRAADPSLAVGPLVYEFGRAFDDWDFLGKATVAGHLLECAGQASGGYFADPGFKDVPMLWDVGFPIVEFCENGDFSLEKLPDCGGLVSRSTVTEQLLYEIMDPAAYLTPDVTADFSRVTIEDAGRDRVIVKGGTGRSRPDKLKVSIGYSDGWIGEGEISYGGHNAERRAGLAADIMRRRLEGYDINIRELRVDLMGINSLFGEAEMPRPAPAEVRVRVAARVDGKADALIIGREAEAMYTNGPAGGCGARGYARQIVSVASVLVPRGDIRTDIVWKEVRR